MRHFTNGRQTMSVDGADPPADWREITADEAASMHADIAKQWAAIQAKADKPRGKGED
jgi:hypothetical protein